MKNNKSVLFAILLLSIIMTGCGKKYTKQFYIKGLTDNIPGDALYCSENWHISPESRLVLRNVTVKMLEGAKEISGADDPDAYKEYEEKIKKDLPPLLDGCPFFSKKQKGDDLAERETFFVDVDIEAILFSTSKKFLQSMAIGLTPFGVAEAFQDRPSINYKLSVYDAEDNLMAQVIHTYKNIDRHISIYRPILGFGKDELCNIAGSCYNEINHPEAIEKHWQEMKSDGDGDGVPDAIDKCPHTLPVNKGNVDDTGCDKM